MSAGVDEADVGRDVRQFHIGVAPGEVGTVALLPGDPFRVPLVAEFLTDVRDVAHRREHRTMTGRYRGKLITATSTGMGCPSTAIAVEELARVGVTSVIRVGSSAALQPGIRAGDLLVSEGSLRNVPRRQGAGRCPQAPPRPTSTPATRRCRTSRWRWSCAADRLAVGRDHAVHSGLNVSSDAFYAETPEVVAEFSRLGMLNIEMESSAMYVVARLRGMRAGVICSCSSNLVDGASVYDAGQRLHDGWTASIEAALETAVTLDL